MAPLKTKGDLAELKVAADLADRGCRISIPFGEDCDYDLIADHEGRLHRVQVKHTTSDGRIIVVRCRTHSLTNGKVRVVKRYTAAMVDWIAAYDCTTECCYYLPSRELGDGRNTADAATAAGSELPAHRHSKRFRLYGSGSSADPAMEPAGFEPATSSVQATRSAS